MASFYNHYYRYYNPYFMNRERKKPIPSDCREDESASSYSNEIDRDFSRSKECEKDCSASKSFSFGPISFNNPFFGDLESPVFEVFGISLYLDDIIILGLLFFLYQEGVQDEMLYIALILLLVG